MIDPFHSRVDMDSSFSAPLCYAMLRYATSTPVCIWIEFELYMKTILVLCDARLLSFDKRCSWYDLREDGWMK